MGMGHYVEVLCLGRTKATVAMGRCRHRVRCYVQSPTSVPDHSSNGHGTDDFTAPLLLRITVAMGG
jgi:hypothetical protein